MGVLSSLYTGVSGLAAQGEALGVTGDNIANANTTGFKASRGVSAYIWSRNLLNKNYYEQLLPAGGNAGQYAAVLGDQRTFGITLRYTL